MRRYGMGLYEQIEVFEDPEFYHRLCEELEKHPEIKLSYPLTKAVGWPQIIEIVKGVVSALIILLTLWEKFGNKKNTKVRVCFRDNRLVELDTSGVKELKLYIENES